MNYEVMQFIMIMMTKAYHTFLGFSWHILFADVAVINITFQVIFTYDIFFGVIHKALIRMGVNIVCLIQRRQYIVLICLIWMLKS